MEETKVADIATQLDGKLRFSFWNKKIVGNTPDCQLMDRKASGRITKNLPKSFLTFAPSIFSMTSTQEKDLTDLLEAIETTDVRDLVVYNDDFNTFEHVIATLMRVCKHSPEQAEQCTLLIHYKGKRTVKTGSWEELKPQREGICEAGIDAKIV